MLSPVVAGAWRLAEWGWPPQERLRWIEQRLDIGITSFDHADMHGDHRVEALFGEAMALAPALRRRLQIVSTCSIGQVATAGRAAPHGSAAAQVRASVDGTLAALRTDHLDLLLIHRPAAAPDAAALADTLATLRREGKVRHFGLANATPAQLAQLHGHCPLLTHQLELSLLHPQPLQDGTLAQCQTLGLRPMAWSPLAGGRIFTSDEPAAQRVRATLQAAAAELGTTPTTLAVAWVLAHPSRPLPIIGSRRLDVAREALAASALALDALQWQRLRHAGAGHAAP